MNKTSFVWIMHLFWSSRFYTTTVTYYNTHHTKLDWHDLISNVKADQNVVLSVIVFSFVPFLAQGVWNEKVSIWYNKQFDRKYDIRKSELQLFRVPCLKMVSHCTLNYTCQTRISKEDLLSLSFHIFHDRSWEREKKRGFSSVHLLTTDPIPYQVQTSNLFIKSISYKLIT